MIVVGESSLYAEPISWKKKINPLWWLKNEDDPVPPEWYKPESKELWRKVCWWFRNPFHNWCFYVIGVADRYVDVYYLNAFRTGVFFKGWNFTLTHVMDSYWLIWVWLPFVSYYNPHFRAYIGWRPGGCWGIKFNISIKGTLTK